MRNALLIVSVLLVAIMSTACINNFAVQELNNKAAEYMAKGDYAAAIGRLEASLYIEPGIFETNYNLGVASISAEDYEKAVGALTKAVSIKSDVSDAYFSLAVAQYNYAEKLQEQKVVEGEDKTEPATNEDLQKASELYSDAIESLEKFLSFSNISEDEKTSATSQLVSIKSKLSDLQKQLPPIQDNAEG